MADPPERAKAPTIAEVADRAGVSIATVSRVISGQARYEMRPGAGSRRR